MKLTKKLEAEVRKVYKTFWDRLLKADTRGMAEVLDNKFKQIGTTDGEIFFSKTEALDFVKATADQIIGNIELRNRKIKTEPVEEFILIIEEADTYVRIDTGWAFYAKFRGSTFLQQKANKWKLIQQHISFPDAKAQEGETIALEQISAENIQLREAVQRRTVELEEKNRELEIETALEKVRAVAMGMKGPNDCN